MLGPIITSVRTLDYNAFQGQRQQFGIVDVGSSHHHAPGPPLSSTRMLRLLPALPRSVVLRPTESPQNGLCPEKTPSSLGGLTMHGNGLSPGRVNLTGRPAARTSSSSGPPDAPPDPAGNVSGASPKPRAAPSWD